MQVENELSNKTGARFLYKIARKTEILMLFESTGNAEHFADIFDVMKSEGIVVPLTFNDWARQNYYSSGPISADICTFVPFPLNSFTHSFSILLQTELMTILNISIVQTQLFGHL